MTLSVPDVPAIDVYAKSGSQGDVVDSMYAFVTEHCHLSLLVDPLADRFNLGESRIRTVVSSTEEHFSFFAFVDSYQGPSEVVVNRGSLAGVPDSADD